MRPNTATPAGEHLVPPPILLLVVISAIGPIALNIFMPSMPGIQRVFGVDYATAQLTLTFYLVAMAVSQIVFGPLSDRFGRRPMLIIGLGCFVIGSGLAALAPSIDLLILARLLQGLGGASGIAIGRAIIRDCYGRERSASMIGYVTMAMVLGPMVAPFFGGLLDETYGWRGSFVALVAVGVPMLGIVVIALRETHVHRGDGAVFAPIISGAAILLRNAAFWGYALTLAFASAAYFAFLAAAPYIAIDVMGLPPSSYGMYFILGAVGYMFGNFLSGRLSEQIGPDRMILAGNVIAVAATAGMIAVSLAGSLHPLALFVPMAFVAISNGLVLPNATACVVSIRPDLAGAAAGLSGAIQLGTGALATILVSAFLNTTLLPLALVMGATIALSCATSQFGERASENRRVTT